MPDEPGPGLPSAVSAFLPENKCISCMSPSQGAVSHLRMRCRDRWELSEEIFTLRDSDSGVD